VKSFIFPGQGSQIKGMGAELFTEFKDKIKRVNEILCYSLEDLILEDENNLLNNTLFAQPALYVVSCLEYMKNVNENNIKPDYLAGHSLGEFIALFAAGVYDFETGLKIVNKRAQIMSKVENGAMATVVGEEITVVQNIVSKIDGLFIANYNSEIQTVISGTKDSIHKAQELFQERGVGYYILPINCPCHSPMLQSSASEFKSFLSSYQFKEPKIPIISNFTGREYEYKDMHDTIANQMCNPVRWKESMYYLLKKDVTDYSVVGPSHVIKKIVDKNIKEFS